MQRLRTLNPGQNYTQVSNESLDRLPDLDSVGLLAHVLRPTDEWTFTLERLVNSKPGVTRRKASNARATLIRHGYIVVVKYRHNYRGQFATEVWRSVFPHTSEQIATIGSRYTPGATTQIPQLDADKRPRVDNLNRVIVREVTITWARVESSLGAHLVGPAGELVVDEKATGDAPDEAP